MSEMIRVTDLHTNYFTCSGTVKAVDGANLLLKKGQRLGVAGESGCGKSTLAMSILRLLQPPHKVVSGDVVYKGRSLLDMSEKEFRDIRWNEISLVLQQSMYALNPMLRISNQMIEPLTRIGIDRKEALEKAAELLELVGLEPKRMDNFPHEFSGGMKQRVLIALSLISNPEVVLLDEPTTALDVVVQHTILKLIDDLCKKLDLSVIWITHDLAVLAEICDRVAIMYAGRIVETGTTEDVILSPKHPYTMGLLGSFPTIDQLDKDLTPIPGTPPDLINPPKGCRFHPRCPYKGDICERVAPEHEPLESRKDGFIECHRWREI